MDLENLLVDFYSVAIIWEYAVSRQVSCISSGILRKLCLLSALRDFYNQQEARTANVQPNDQDYHCNNTEFQTVLLV